MKRHHSIVQGGTRLQQIDGLMSNTIKCSMIEERGTGNAKRDEAVERGPNGACPDSVR